MSRTAIRLVLLVVLAAGAGAYFYLYRAPAALVLTGIVTTDDVIVSPQIGGQIEQLLAKEGDAVKKAQLVAVIVPDELRADTAYYTHNVAGLSSQVQESEAALRYQERQTADQILQAESNLASSEAQVAAAAADLENARLVYSRTENLSKKGVVSPQDLDQSRTAANAAQAKLDALRKQVDAQPESVLDLGQLDLPTLETVDQLGQHLLRRRNQPDVTTLCLARFSEASEVEQPLGRSRDVLAHFVDDQHETLAVRSPPGKQCHRAVDEPSLVDRRRFGHVGPGILRRECFWLQIVKDSELIALKAWRQLGLQSAPVGVPGRPAGAV